MVDAPSQPSSILNQDGAVLIISPNTWDGYPSDLSRYDTPIQIQIENDPGARVEGFLFLQQATRVGNLLTLSWMPTTADGTPLPTLGTEFRIVR
jgi:hypothetical protein